MFDHIKDAELSACLNFVIKVDSLKGVLRKTSPIGMQRLENTAEHSWHLIVMALALEKYANEPVEILKVVKMLALHDLGEIGVGDICLYASDRDDAEAKERDVVDGLFSDLPEGLKTEFKALWAEFAEGCSAEARYARALDRFQPFLSNISNKGGSWKSLGISKDRALAKNKHIGDGSNALWQVYQDIVPEAEKLGFFKTTG